MLPTPDEVRNGWTEKTLTDYLKDHKDSGKDLIDMNSDSRRVRPQTQNHKYNPKRWRE